MLDGVAPVLASAQQVLAPAQQVLASAQQVLASAAEAPDIPPQLVSLGIALGVGLLVGLERERHADTVAGVRTFGLVGLIGGLSALLTPPGTTPWPLVVAALLAGFAGVWGGIASRRPTPMRDGEFVRDIGLTTAFALVVTTLLGGYSVLGDRATTLVAAGVLFLLLYLREPLHGMIRRLGQEDVRAIATFVLIALVILPVLPNRDVGPFDAINPREAWLLVVLVVSMSLAGYVAQSLLGARGGILATGLLGGLVSSTATTVGAARRAREDGRTDVAAAISLLACGVLPARLAILVAIVSPALFGVLSPWLAGAAVFCIGGGLVALRRAGRDGGAPLPKPRNPTQLRSALAFAGIFVVIRILSKATIEFGGDSAFLAVAAASGITDMDAIAMSTAREVADLSVGVSLGAKAVLIALVVNTLFKLGVTVAVGTGDLFRSTQVGLLGAAICAVVGIVLS
jgi:uncharacterized membrane protein (DUF4010 family)